MALRAAVRRAPTSAPRRARSDAPAPPPHHGILRKPFVARVPKEEVQRPHLGRTVDLTVIDAAIRSANRGYMRRMSDLGLETLKLDGHASACWQKRMNRLAALNWEIVKAEGEDINEQIAEDCAGMVRDQLKQISNFRQCLMDINQGAYHGRAGSEIEWYHHRRQWRVRGLDWIHARRLSFGPQRDLRVIDLNSEQGDFADVGFPLEQVPYKFVVYKPRMFGDYPEREGLCGRTVFWSFFGRFGVRERLHLLEVFGKPWRIAMPELEANGAGINDDQLNEAFDALNRLGGQSTAVLPIAMKLLVAQPTKGAGDVHFDAIDHAEKTISKLYLGATGTTDAVSTGLGSSVGDQHANEEDLIIASDAWRLSECVEDQLTDAIVIVNLGPEYASHAPTFRLRTDPPQDRLKEGDRISKALDIGLDVAIDEAREVIGIREPRDGEVVLRRMPRNTGGALPFYSPLPEQVFPSGKQPDPGTMLPLPTVPGAPPVQPPGGGGGGFPGSAPALPAPLATETPRGDVELTDAEDVPQTDEAVERLAAKMTEFQVERCQHEKINRCRLCGIERERDFEMSADGVAKWKILWKPIGKARAPAAVSDLEEERSSENDILASTLAAAASRPSPSRTSPVQASARPTTSRRAEPRQPSKRQASLRKRSRERSPA